MFHGLMVWNNFTYNNSETYKNVNYNKSFKSSVRLTDAKGNKMSNTHHKPVRIPFIYSAPIFSVSFLG